MQIIIDNKHELGERVGFFDNTFVNKPHGQEVETRECTGVIKKIVIEITDSDISHRYEVQDNNTKYSFWRDDNTLLEKI